MASASPSAPQSGTASASRSRRASQIYPMSPPPLPLGLASPGSTHGIPASQPPPLAQTYAFPPLSPHSHAVVDANLPMRHPRPLTTAELYMEVEKEQEAIVNRLTRELSALRAHSASVSSTVSNASATGEPVPRGLPGQQHQHSGTPADHGAIPYASTDPRRHRSSSSISRIPAQHHRYSVSSQQGAPDVFTVGGAPSVHLSRSTTGASMVSSPRWEEVAHYRQELEEAKRENAVLRQKVVDLEEAIREHSKAAEREDAARGRSGAPMPSVAP